MNNKEWFAKAFRIFITAFIFAFYIAMVFFQFRQDWSFLGTWEYWIDTLSATTVALVLRWLYSDSGVTSELQNNTEIKELEKGKGNLIQKVNSNNLTGELKAFVDKQNKENKIQAYKNKCDKKINFYRDKKWYLPFIRKPLLNKWRTKRKRISDDDFNIHSIRIWYDKFDYDTLMSTFYKDPSDGTKRRMSKNAFVTNSLRTNLMTLMFFMIYNALNVLAKDFQTEDIVILLGKMVIFSVNIYTGFNLGKKFISNLYSQNLTEDYTLIKRFLKENSIK